MPSAPDTIILLLALSVSAPLAAGKGFLREQNAIDAAEAFGLDLQVALGEVMGCGGQVDHQYLNKIERSLLPMWRTLPKKSNGKADWRSVRYIIHRYFKKQSSLTIRGFELLHSSNMSEAGILTQQIPTYVDKALGRTHKEGFSVSETAYLVATLEQLIFDSETHLMESVYAHLHTKPDSALTYDELKSVLETYMLHWILGDDEASLKAVMNDRRLLEAVFPNWQSMQAFVGGRINMLRFEGMHRSKSGHAKKIMSQQYDFDDAHSVVGGITKTFQAYWESECEHIKAALIAMDKTGTGRVHLSDFYRAGLEEEARFAESEEYLREMGVLDESAMFYGKQVIISNYMQGVSNCIVTTPHYRICCSNPCESIQEDIESDVGSAFGMPSQILGIVGNMTTEDDTPIKLRPVLIDQLKKIAERHGGEVPLHGRLFAQWLHYVFPNECVFPHKAGSVSLASPLEFGKYEAAKFEMHNHVLQGRPKSHNETDLESLVMSQWSEEEELFADYSMELKAPWEGHQHFAVAGVMLLAVAALFASLKDGGRKAPVNFELPLNGKACGKSHWI